MFPNLIVYSKVKRKNGTLDFSAGDVVSCKQVNYVILAIVERVSNRNFQLLLYQKDQDPLKPFLDKIDDYEQTNTHLDADLLQSRTVRDKWIETETKRFTKKKPSERIASQRIENTKRVEKVPTEKKKNKKKKIVLGKDEYEEEEEEEDDDDDEEEGENEGEEEETKKKKDTKEKNYETKISEIENRKRVRRF